MANASARAAAPSSQQDSPSSKFDIILSFASPQQTLVTRILHDLRRRYKIWYWPMDSNKYAYQNVARTMAECSTVIICLSSDYTESENCCKEALLAHNTNKKIIPIQVSRSKANRDRLPFLRRQAILLDVSETRRFDEAIAKLYDIIEASIPKFVQPVPVRSITPPTESQTGRHESNTSTPRPTTALSRSTTTASEASNQDSVTRSSTLVTLERVASAKPTLSNAAESSVTAPPRRPRSAWDSNILKMREPLRRVGLAIRTEVKRRKLLKCEDDVTNPCLFGLAVVEREVFVNDVNNGVKHFNVQNATTDQYGDTSRLNLKSFTQRNTAGLYCVAPNFLITAFRSNSDRGVWLLNVNTKTAMQFRLPPCDDAAFPCSFGVTDANEVLVSFQNEKRIHEFQLLPESYLLTRKGDYKVEKPLHSFYYNQKLNASLAIFTDNEIEVLVLNRQFSKIGSIRPPPLDNDFSWRPAWEPRLAILTDRGLCLVYCDCSKEVHAFDIDGTYLTCVSDSIDVLSWMPLRTDKAEIDIFFFDRKSHSLEHLSIK